MAESLLRHVSDPEHLQARLDEGETALREVRGLCQHCRQAIYPVIVWTSGVIDWEIDGDSGCDASPDTDEDGTGGHVPCPPLDR